MPKFNNLYMRPNMSNTGEIPVTGSVYGCPDIWVAGDTAVPNHLAFITASENYSKCGVSNCNSKLNYLYLRCSNHEADPDVSQAYMSMFYNKSGGVLWPEVWKNQKIPTDQGTDVFKNAIYFPPGSKVGVSERPFVLRNLTSSACLVGWLNDNQNSNPLPEGNDAIRVADLIKNNLRYAQRNLTYSQVEAPTHVYTFDLDIPANIRNSGREYHLYLEVKNCKGCEVEYTASSSDSSGVKIGMARTRISSDDSVTYGSNHTLEPGFTAKIEVFLYSMGVLKPNPPICSFNTTYDIPRQEMSYAQSMNVINPEWSHRLLNAINSPFKGVRQVAKIGINSLIVI